MTYFSNEFIFTHSNHLLAKKFKMDEKTASKYFKLKNELQFKCLQFFNVDFFNVGYTCAALPLIQLSGWLDKFIRKIFHINKWHLFADKIMDTIKQEQSYFLSAPLLQLNFYLLERVIKSSAFEIIALTIW